MTQAFRWKSVAAIALTLAANVALAEEKAEVWCDKQSNPCCAAGCCSNCTTSQAKTHKIIIIVPVMMGSCLPLPASPAASFGFPVPSPATPDALSPSSMTAPPSAPCFGFASFPGQYSPVPVAPPQCIRPWEPVVEKLAVDFVSANPADPRQCTPTLASLPCCPPAPITLVGCATTMPAAAASATWSMHVVTTEGKAHLAIECGNARLKCTQLAMELANGVQIQLARTHHQVLMSCPYGEAMADSLKKGDEDTVILQGQVKLAYHHGDTTAEVRGDKVIINMKDGSLKVEGTKVSDN